MSKLIFIEPPHVWMDRNTRKMRNYGVERLLARLIKHKIITEDKYACYDFSFDKLKESATEQEIAEYINKQIANLPHSEWICFSVMETNYQNALYFANYLKEQHNFEIVNIGNVDHMNDFGLLDGTF